MTLGSGVAWSVGGAALYADVDLRTTPTQARTFPS